jgi:hypothetical protein
MEEATEKERNYSLETWSPLEQKVHVDTLEEAIAE